MDQSDFSRQRQRMWTWMPPVGVGFRLNCKPLPDQRHGSVGMGSTELWTRATAAEEAEQLKAGMPDALKDFSSEATPVNDTSPTGTVLLDED
jgi:hypothetical protein